MALSAEEELVVREWSPLTHLFQKLPTRHQGFFSSDLKLTCMDAISELIAMGTNLGIVYVYNRKTHNMERLKCENLSVPITCIKVISTVDYMLAVGNRDGNVNIFQLPKVPPESLPLSLRPKDKQVERYSVSEMHKGQVTALEWSKNGMKLFSGDATGHVVLTEIDFYMHLCKSCEILDEAYAVVQLNYLQQRLLVSTTYRSIICQKQDKWRVCQVGKKDRKLLGKFGGTIMQNGLGPTDLVLYCVRPGLRIWQADLAGSVEKTILFKDSLNDASPEVFILNPLPPNLKRTTKEPSFGVIHQFHENYLVTHNSQTVYILNVKDLKIIGIVNQLRGVLDVSVHKDEIFILESDRSLIRISPFPEYTDAPFQPTSNISTPILTTSLKELTNKLQSASIITAAPTKTAFPMKSPAIATAEEAIESKKSPLKTPTTPVTPTEGPMDRAYQIYRKLELYNKISEKDYDEVIGYTHRKKKKTRKQTPTENVMTSSICSYSSNSSGEGDRSDRIDAYTIKPTLMTISTVGMIDIKSPDSLQHDISEKENLLAELLNFDSVKVDLDKLQMITTQDATKPTKNDDILQTSSKVLDELPEVDQNLFPKPETSKTVKPTDKCQSTIPVCRNIPNAWSVQTVSLMDSEPIKPIATPKLTTFANIPVIPVLPLRRPQFQPTSPTDELADWEIV